MVCQSPNSEQSRQSQLELGTTSPPPPPAPSGRLLLQTYQINRTLEDVRRMEDSSIVAPTASKAVASAEPLSAGFLQRDEYFRRLAQRSSPGGALRWIIVFADHQHFFLTLEDSLCPGDGIFIVFACHFCLWCK